MITVESFRQKIRESQSVSVVDEVLLAPAAIHVATCDIEHIKTSLVGKFNAAATAVEIWVIGSAKLGFSITEKRLPDGTKLPRYRTFSPASDVDIAVVSSSIFELIWNELSIHAYQSPRLPWNSGALGDYLIGGWLRPDHFPKGVRLLDYLGRFVYVANQISNNVSAYSIERALTTVGSPFAARN
jgi:hypothetical protein